MGGFPKLKSHFPQGTGDPLHPEIGVHSVLCFRRGPVSGQQSGNCSLEKERDTFLWRIDTKVRQKNLKKIETIASSGFQPPSYFFGTIHVPYTRVWDAVSTNTKKAFHAADKVRTGFEDVCISPDWQVTDILQVYFELDLTNPYTIAALTSCQLLPRGLNLSQVVQLFKLSLL